MRHSGAIRRDWDRAFRVATMVLVCAPFGLVPLEAAGDPGLAALAARAAAGDLDAARELRAAGPSGLSALVDVGVSAPGRDVSPAYRSAIDLVCAQFDCAASRLYWYTDFEAARRAAEASGRPILALRLLGRLDEELSCANSRYFRTLLYSDPAISGWLREHAVLFWSSERPVPRVTVDYGDGRRLVGTVTGNSIHYLLDPRGRLIDALPGLHTPQRFLAWINGGADLSRSLAALDEDAFDARLRREHERLDGALVTEMRAGLVRAGWPAEAARGAWGAIALEAPGAPAPTAADAAPLARSKSAGEEPLLSALGMPIAPREPSAAVATLSRQPAWRARLSRPALDLVAAHASGKARADLPAAIERMEQRLAEDGVYNEAELHRRIHAALARAERAPRWQDFNAWVYSALFLTPASDPWLGLAPTEALWGLRVESR
jgi:hypothetical protein